jgi:hypothetical protein
MPKIQRGRRGYKKLEIRNTKHETNPNNKNSNDQNSCFEF